MKSQKGMTLVEVVIAISVLGIIAAGFMAGLGTACDGHQLMMGN